MTRLYHREVRWEKTFDQICNDMLFKRSYISTNHLKDKCKERGIDYQGVLEKLEEIRNRNSKYNIFEIEDSKYITKFVLRTYWNDFKDISIVFRNEYDYRKKQPYLLVETVWLNDKDDNHISLNKNKYYTNRRA